MLVYQKVSKVPLQSTFAYYMFGTIDESNSLFEEKHWLDLVGHSTHFYLSIDKVLHGIAWYCMVLHGIAVSL